MKCLRTIVVFDKGNVAKDPDWATIYTSYVQSIQAVDHPAGSGKFTLRRAIRGLNNQWVRNGVGYMRSSFLRHMAEVGGWQPEATLQFPTARIQPTLKLYPSGAAHTEPVTSRFGSFDFQIVGENGLRVAIEWETGNISSSHRSINKLAIALAAGVIQAGVLIVPSRDCYAQLTDRVGNIGELSGYLELWEAAKAAVTRGLLAISVVEHDEVTDDPTVPYLKAGKSGRAQKAKRKAADQARRDKAKMANLKPH